MTNAFAKQDEALGTIASNAPANGMQPVIYGQSDRPPRGDYSQARADYTCDQHYAAYTVQDHATYAQLYARQSALLPGLAAQAFIDTLPHLGASSTIPRFEDINAQLLPATGWQLVGVPGLIPEVPFFTLLSQRKFPVTTWIRTPQELDYIVEPDLFHDLFGHVPLLFDASYANHIQAYGLGALKAHQLEHGPAQMHGAVEMLSRLYWYTIEFGLLREGSDLRAYGAGILSSGGELQHSIHSTEPQHIALQTEANLLQCMASTYKIDTYQQQYFVIDSFEALLRLTTPDFTPHYRQLGALKVPADAIAANL
jgi:phenylalanine-4-hydroxylase